MAESSGSRLRGAVGIERQHRNTSLLKFDGYRMLARVGAGEVKLIARNGHDWTSRMQRLQEALEATPVDAVWLDAQAVVLDASGKPDFNALQSAFDRCSTTEIILFVFDLR